MTQRIAAALALFLMFLPRSALAQEAPAKTPETIAQFDFVKNPETALAGLEELHFPKIEKHTSYVMLAGGLHASAVQSASGLIAPLGSHACPGILLRWSWRVDEAPLGSGKEGKSGDDYGARMVAVFDYDEELHAWYERLARLVLGGEFERKVPGAAVEYVWSPYRDVGDHWGNPYTDKARMISVKGKKGAWVQHTARPCEDYKQDFGRDPTPFLGIFLMTDADDSASSARAVYGSVEVLRE